MIEEPFNYTVGLRGKELRGEFVEIFAQWTGANRVRIEIVKEAVQVLHNASLMIDDIEDGAQVRRGRPCAYLVYGAALTINSANLAYFQALEQVLRLGDFDAVAKFTQAMIDLHQGQGMEIAFRESGRKPTQADYHEIVQKKTGTLLWLAVALLGGTPEHEHVASEIGAIYQMIDDYRNLFARSESDSDFADDLREGKFTLATIHGLESLRQTASLDDRLRIVSELRRGGSDAFVLDEIERRLDRLAVLASSLPHSHVIIGHLKALLYSK